MPVIREKIKQLAVRACDSLWRRSAARQEILEFLQDTSIRAHDTQDRAYDIMSGMQDARLCIHDTQSRVRGLAKDMKDTNRRAHATQDRAYDILWQIKTQNHQREMMFWQLYKRPEEDLEDAQLRFFRALPAGGGKL